MPKDFITVADWSSEELLRILDRSQQLRRLHRAGERPQTLQGRTLAMYFEKPSLRTHVTFEAGMTQLVGNAILLRPEQVGIGTRESAADVSRNLSRWVDGLVARTFSHSVVQELAEANEFQRQQIRRQILERIIRDQLVRNYLAENGYRVGDRQLTDLIQQEPQFQVDGQFDQEAYLDFLQTRGRDPREFEESLRSATGDVEEHRVGQCCVHGAEARRQQLHDAPEFTGPLLVKQLDRFVGDLDGIGALECSGFGRAPQPIEQAHLAEEVARLHEGDDTLTAVDGTVGDRNAARRHHEQRRWYVPLGEQDIAATEVPLDRCTHDSFERIIVDLGKEQGRSQQRGEHGGVRHRRSPD